MGSGETERLGEHGGNVRRLMERLALEREDVLDFSSNINPYGPPDGVMEAVRNAVERIGEYPEQQAESFVAAVAAALQVGAEHIVAGNGSIELIYLIAELSRRDKALLVIPSFTEYEVALRKAGAHIAYKNALSAGEALHVLADASREADIALIGNPNNPCGYRIERSDMLRLIDERGSCLWVIDEAFIDFLAGPPGASLVEDAIERENVVVLRSLTKMYGIAGLRLGYLVASPAIARRVIEMKYPWSVNTIALEAGIAALSAGGFVEMSVEALSAEAERLYRSLAGIAGLKPFAPSANYILIEIRSDMINPTAPMLQEEMLKRGIAIRDCSSYTGLDERYFRVAVKRPEDNDRLLAALKEIFS